MRVRTFEKGDARMMRRWGGWGAPLLVWLVLGGGGSAYGASDPRMAGPYDVGVTTIEIIDEAREGRRLVTEIWYPADLEGKPPGEYYAHLLWGNALRDAKPDPSGGPYPLIVFSHGSNAIRLQSVFLTEHLASFGYIVVAPDHPGNTFYDSDDILTARGAIDRPLDIRTVIDTILAMDEAGTFPVGGIVDETKIGMTGHSYGAYTTLMVCGAKVNVDVARARCAEGKDDDCEMVRYAEALFGEDVQWVSLPDPRVDACVPMAPGGYRYFGEEGLSPIALPQAVMGAMKDTITEYDVEILPIYDAISVQKSLLSLKYRNHYAFSDILYIRPATGWRCRTFADCHNPDPSHEVIVAIATAFFGLHLGQDPAWAPFLTPAFVAENYPFQATFEVGGP
ncbi:MAG: hypothetical protein D6812_04730 [Deltaproteobacteria bacterium]|nr:MAG: hypothetical protein D6812_04730 [Deltaproteobacteria bacterium]